MSLDGMSLPGRGSRAKPAQVRKNKRRAMIVRRTHALAAQKVAAEVRNTDKSDGLDGVVAQLARKETR
ncbi:MAG: hypothetical protein ACRCU1_02790 [Alsobacter sp.]